MYGLLGTDFDDPKTQGILGLALGLLSGSGPSPVKRTFGSILGDAGQAGIQQYRVAQELGDRRKERGQIQQMREVQLAELMERKRREDEMRSVLQNSYQSPAQQALAGGGGPTPENAALIPQMPGGFNFDNTRNELLRRGNIEGASLIDSLRPKAKSPLVTKPGDVLRDPDDVSRVLAQNPEAEKLDALIIKGPDGRPMINPLVMNAKRELAQAGAARVSVAPQFNTGEKGFKHSIDLSSAFKNEPIYKAHQEVTSAYGQIRAALENPSGASDLAAATKFMKLLDPGSVVRESELVMAMSTSGLLDRMANYANMVITGQKLTPTQRAQFRDMTDKLFEESRSLYNQKRQQYGAVATRYGLDAEVLPAESVPRVKIGPAVDYRKLSDAELMRMMTEPNP